MSARACTSIQRIDGSTAIAPDVAMHPDRAAMQADARHQRARRQQHDARAVTAEIGIELERARHHGRRGDAAAAVADHDDLVGGVGPRDLDKALRAGLDAAVPARRLAARVFQQIRPMAVDLHHEELVGERTQQLEANGRAAMTATMTPNASGPSIKRIASHPISHPANAGTSASHQTSMIWNVVSAMPY